MHPANPPHETAFHFGLASLDELLGGVEPGQLVVLAGWPCVGLSALARYAAEHAAVQHHQPTGFVLLDASMEDYVEALLLSRARVGTLTIREGTASEADHQRIAHVADELARAPLYFDDTPTATLDDLCARLRVWFLQHAIRLLIVDGFEARQLTTRDGHAPSLVDLGESPEVIGRMKALALELGLVIVVLCRLRPDPSWVGGGPGLAALCGCDDLATHADAVLLLHQEGMRTQLVITKTPGGQTGTVELLFDEAACRFNVVSA